MSETTNIFGDDPFNSDDFVEAFPDLESTPLVFMTTTSIIEGKPISDYHGMVFGEAAFGVGFATDAYQSVQAIFGVRSGSTERRMEQARRQAMFNASEQAKSRGGNAMVGVRVDLEFSGSVILVSITGTAVSAAL